MSQQNTFVRGELSSYFDEAIVKVGAVASLLNAVEDQNQMNETLVNQLFGLGCLLKSLGAELGELQRRADEVETWAIVSVKRVQEGKV